MDLAVVGSRTYTNYPELKRTLDNLKPINKIISGGANGADKLAERYAKENKIALVVFLPDWNKYGKSAGPIRNEQIVLACGTLVAFWDGFSKGTKSSIDLAKKHKKELLVIYPQ